MYFRRLELQGFKTFANRSCFEFGPGITAIVGPNGSGKSNIADAIRWVLGEQSSRALRAKRTEDLIFTGSSNRAPLGMAEVTIVLDNSDGWCELPYSEISITRRAYRSGENEYLINGHRARLRDVIELLAQGKLVHNTYTVIGQGLIDSILNLRPEERRGLFEDVADIRRYYTKLADTQAKLAATEQNITRVTDIAAEIAPRLATLEKQAKLAEQRIAMAEELERLQKTWYAQLRREVVARVAEACAREQELTAQLATLEEQGKSVAQRIAAVRAAEIETRESLAKWRMESEPFRAGCAALSEEIAVARERVRTCNQQIEELHQEIGMLERQAIEQADALSSARDQAATWEHEREEIEAAIAFTQGKLQEIRERNASTAANLSLLRADALAKSASVSEAEQMLAQVRGKRQGIQQERREREKTAERISTSQKALQSKAEALQQALSEIGRSLAAAEERRREIQTGIMASRERQERLSASIDRQTRERDERQTRYGLLLRLEDARSGYFPGVRAILEASRSSNGENARLSGIIGIVGKLIKSEERIETAIDVALGARVQDIVVERWQDAERAIAFLKASARGRATFLPLDTIKSVEVGRLPVHFEGVIGIAAELVSYEKRFRSIVSLLLGKTIVVEDLRVARQALPKCPPGWQIVTLAGEIVRSSGAVTGGYTDQQSGMLRRMRDLRDLPEQISALEESIKAEQEALLGERTRQRRLIAELEALEREQRKNESKRRVTENELIAVQQQITRGQSELEWVAARIRELEEEDAELATAEQAYSEQLQRIAAERNVVLEGLQLAELETTQQRQEEEALLAQVSDLKVALAVVLQRLTALRDSMRVNEDRLQRLREQIRDKQARLEEVEKLRLATQGSLQGKELQLVLLSEKLRGLEELMLPAEQRIAELGKEFSHLLQDEAKLRQAQHEISDLYQKAAIAAQKARDELEALDQRIVDDLGVDAVNDLQEQKLQSLPLSEPEESALGNTDALKRRIDQLKSSLRSLSSVSSASIDEYRETLARYEFLTEQVEDLKQGAEALRRVIAELHKTMRKKFQETFKAVANEFQSCFRALFGGGSARLILTDPNDFTNTGVEIVVQPPGKRAQTLASLSGGERALTGVALLFAVLAVNPSPLCVLDEADAALDETNVGRFCAALKKLTRTTQFIVITHNRGTMEVADALYGVSISAAGISTVVSVRLSETENKTNNGWGGAKPASELAAASSDNINFLKMH